jgi:D-alanyl-D-alanine dipeptidase
MHPLNKVFFYFSPLWIVSCYSHILDEHQQLLTVTVQDWNEHLGELNFYERENGNLAWTPIQGPIPVVIGKNGLSWGIGLHPMNSELSYKKEGDGKSPAGIFSLGCAFGFAPHLKHLKIDYLPLNEFIEAVDDPLSSYYNSIVDRREVTPDWQSSEKMFQEPLYQVGLTVHHNFPHPKAYRGSAIFLHIWQNEHSGTAGCTAMSLENLNTVLSWLDPNKHPVLVQLPIHTYNELQNPWGLPDQMKDSLLKSCNLVDISVAIPDIFLNLRYATADNFLNAPVYTKPACYLHKRVAEALLRVQKELSSMGLGLKIFDGYRPLSVQQMMWDLIQDERYVSNPAKNKGRHTRGTAVDLTLVDLGGQELEMPTPFDDFTEKAHSNYLDLSEIVLQNRALLAKVMKKEGFHQLPTEWWHFDFEGWQDDAQFPPLDIPL